MSNLMDNIIRGHLQTASVAYQPQGFIGEEIYPRLIMESPRQKIAVFNKGDHFRNEATRRAPGTVAPVGDMKASFVDLSSQTYHYSQQITQEELWADGKPTYPSLALKQQKVEMVAQKLGLAKEYVIAASVTGATWNDGNSGGEDADAKWTASSGNTFLDDIDTGINSLRAVGIPATSLRLAMDDKTYRGVRRNGGIVSVNQYTKSGLPGAEDIAAFIGVSKVVVGSAIYSSNEEAAAGTDFTAVNIWGGANDKGYAILYYFPQVITHGMMCAGIAGANKMENGDIIANYEHVDTKAHTYTYEGWMNIGAAQVAAAAAYAWKDTHTT
jgi:hypothetical protein